MPMERKYLLKFANIAKNEVKEFNPLRARIGISLEFLAKQNKDELRLLGAIINKLSGKRSDERTGWEEIKNQ